MLIALLYKNVDAGKGKWSVNDCAHETQKQKIREKQNYSLCFWLTLNFQILIYINKILKKKNLTHK